MISGVAIRQAELETALRRAAVPVEARYELMPFRQGEEQAGQVDRKLRLTVTTSPKHGVDRSLDVAVRLRRVGHGVALHLAARMVRSEAHLDELLERAHEAAIDDLFVVGGDVPTPLGPFTSAADLLDLVARHPLRPARLGIAGYPQPHPLIPPAALEEALERKAVVADYLVTQLCFDVNASRTWVEGVRARGIELPVYVGAAGPVERRRLLEISARIGVGPSLRFLRKQRGLAALVRSPSATADAFYDEASALVDVPSLGIAGFHFFTFNDLLGTLRWHEER
jgi:methylenetetrahydrofolate reductase (NADPH)